MKLKVGLFTTVTLIVVFFSETLVQGQKMIKNEIKYDLKGTRSQQRHGYLYINDSILPDIFKTVFYKNDVYRFCQSINPFGDEGYFPSEEKPVIALSEKEIAHEFIEKGWYIGNKKMTGTPDDWMYVEWGSSRAFISPEKVQCFIDSMKLHTIIRSLSEN